MLSPCKQCGIASKDSQSNCYVILGISRALILYYSPIADNEILKEKKNRFVKLVWQVPKCDLLQF